MSRLLGPGHAVLGHVAFPFGFVTVVADAEENEAAGCLRLRRWTECSRKSLDAGTAPGGPEVDEDNLAANRVERDELCAVGFGDLECRRRLCSSQDNIIGKVFGAQASGSCG